MHCKPTIPTLNFPPQTPGALEHLHFLIHQLIEKVDAIMATEQELIADVNAVKDQMVKIGLETSATLDKVTALEAAQAAAGGAGGTVS